MRRGLANHCSLHCPRKKVMLGTVLFSHEASMKKVFTVLLLALSFTFYAPSVYAEQITFETDATSSQDIQTLSSMGKAFQQYADVFGCTKFAWGHFSPARNTITLEYIPNDGTPVENWTRLMTVTLSKIEAGGHAGVAPDMARLVAGYLEMLNGTGHVVMAQKFTDDTTKDTLLYVEYDIGKGAAKEHNIGVLRRVSQDTAAFIQIQARAPRTPETTDAARVMDLLPKNRTLVP